MAIIRSLGMCRKNWNKLKKVRRRRVDWFSVLVNVQTMEIRNYFNELFSRFKDRKYGVRMSMNRCAYNTLKHFYSTTTIDELCEVLGI